MLSWSSPLPPLTTPTMSSSPPPVPLMKSPARMQASTSGALPQKSFEVFLDESCRYWTHGQDEILLAAACKMDKGRLQDGPQCGMVALTMAFDSLLRSSKVDPPSVDAIQTRAIEMGFSGQGEMFSVENMKTLAETFIDDLSGDETSLTASEFELNVIDSIFLTDPKSLLSDFIRDRANKETVYLVPYDSDFNQVPCLKRGHKAHWGIVLGIVIKCEVKQHLRRHIRTKKTLAPVGERSCSDRRVYLIKEDIEDAEQLEDLEQKIAESLPETFSPIRLLVRQSKSLRLFLFEPESLRASNCNLVEFGRERAGMNVSDYWQERDFVLPPGGVKEGLCGKFLKISRVKNYYSTAEGKGPINEQ